MKIKDITECSERWSTPLGTTDAHAPVADGVLVGLNLWGTSIINLVVECPDGKYFGSLRAPRNVYDRVLEFLKRNHGRKLREVMDAEIDISDVIQQSMVGYLGIVLPGRNTQLKPITRECVQSGYHVE